MTAQQVDGLAAAILAPLGRDAALASSCLRGAGVETVVCGSFEDLLEHLRAGIGVALLTEEVVLSVDRTAALAEVLRAQPAWSDVPIIVFSSRPDAMRAHGERLQQIGNVSFVDRPVQRRTLVAAVRSALRARHRQYEARQAIAAREQFLAMLGHELRNPLSAILFATDLVGRRGSDDPALARYLAGIDRQTRHLNRLVDDLLDVARVTSGKVRLKREPVELVALVRRCLEAQQVMAETHGVTLEAASAGGAVWVNGDVVRLEQVVTNLVTNALKYTERGGRVDVEVGTTAGNALLRVRDTGVGIAPEHLTSIFELFAQAPTTLDRTHGGLGLGLTLVRTLVGLLGGTVEARSAGLGHGSEFTVRLPLGRAAELPAAAEPRADAATPDGEKGRILVIDDNVDLRQMLSELLTMSGYVVTEASDGPQGLTRLISLAPDAALVDIGLPGFDGYELARRARRTLGDGVLLVAMTGYGQAEDRDRAFAAGFDEHLTKPVALEDIEAVLARRGRERAAEPRPA